MCVRICCMCVLCWGRGWIFAIIEEGIQVRQNLDDQTGITLDTENRGIFLEIPSEREISNVRGVTYKNGSHLSENSPGIRRNKVKFWWKSIQRKMRGRNICKYFVKNRWLDEKGSRGDEWHTTITKDTPSPPAYSIEHCFKRFNLEN